MTPVAIVGAGFAGLACAARLAQAGVSCDILDKGRGPGGRAATRRADGGLQFDHGLPFVHARTPAFEAVLEAWSADGRAAPWTGRFGTVTADGFALDPTDSPRRWVGTPKMNALLGGDALRVQFGEDVSALTRSDRGWGLVTKTGGLHGPYDLVLLAIPANQAAVLLAGLPDLAERVAQSRYRPVWTGLAAFADPLPGVSFEAATVADAALDLIVHDGAKPGRSGTPTWVMHGAASWTRDHLEAEKTDMAPRLLDAFQDVMGRMGVAVPDPVYLAAHRWRYARVEAALDTPCLFDPGRGVGACGDWCLGPTVEDAWMSGEALGEAVTRAG
ncbi:MAG: NAD(P)/FAD-dependent oxidoreductase [Alphaproteobacteria bacterium]